MAAPGLERRKGSVPERMRRVLVGPHRAYDRITSTNQSQQIHGTVTVTVTAQSQSIRLQAPSASVEYGVLGYVARPHEYEVRMCVFWWFLVVLVCYVWRNGEYDIARPPCGTSLEVIWLRVFRMVF